MAKSNANVRYEADEKRRHIIIVAIILFLVGLIMVFIGTYAYYQTTSTGSVSGTIATWVFKANNNASTFNISLTPTQTSRTLNSTMAPGTSGSFTITLSTVGSALAANYTITFSNFTNIPSNLKFYSDSSFTTVTDITASGYSLTGTLNAGSSIDKTIYWKWDYGTSSSISADSAAADKAVSFTATVVGTQKQ